MHKHQWHTCAARAGVSRTLCLILATIILTACGGGGGDSGAQSTRGPGGSANSINVDDVRNRVIAWYPIGNSAHDAKNLDVGRDIPQFGWTQFVNNTVIPQISSRGLHRVMLHNPFGVVDGERFQFDQFLRAQARGKTGLTQDFVKAWRPVTSSGTEVIAYIGTPGDDPESQEILDTQGEQTFISRGLAAIAPLLQAGMSIAYDAAAPAQRDSMDFRFAQVTKQQGSKVYIEATPPATHNWWFDYPVISRETTYQNRLRDKSFAGRDQLTGEVLRIARIPAAFVRYQPGNVWPAAICQIIADGDTAVVEDHLLEDEHRTIEGLAECAAALQ